MATSPFTLLVVGILHISQFDRGGVFCQFIAMQAAILTQSCSKGYMSIHELRLSSLYVSSMFSFIISELTIFLILDG